MSDNLLGSEDDYKLSRKPTDGLHFRFLEITERYKHLVGSVVRTELLYYCHCRCVKRLECLMISGPPLLFDQPT